MSDFESRYFDIVGEDHDYDRTILTIDQTNQLLALINQMPVNNRVGEEDTDSQTFSAAGWCEEECTYIDMEVNRIAGMGFYAFCGSENLMVESAEDVATYKAGAL